MRRSFVFKEVSESSGCTDAELESLWTMLLHAAHETELDSVESNPLLRPYVENFGQQNGDLAILVFENGYEGGDIQDKAVGAAWVRLFPGGGLATANIDETQQNLRDLPELAVACLPQYRGQGLGSQLLHSLMVRLKEENEKK